MRSVVKRPGERCPQCRLPPRWCVCPAHQTIACPLQVDVLMPERESRRPSSTGGLIGRVLTGSRSFVWTRRQPVKMDDVRVPGRELWILHPHGEPMPEAAAPEHVQVLLLDGSWREATGMAQDVAGWGRRVSLPMAGESRYWLRAQADGGRFSTVEALMFLLERFGLGEVGEVLRRQFELHVYASLRSRGAKELAREFLATSPAAEAFAEFIATLDTPRPR